MALGLKISLKEVKQKLVLQLEGRLDATSTPLLERRIDGLFEEGHRLLLLDLNLLDYLSSAGLRLLLSETKKFDAQKGALLLYSPTEEVLEVIKMAGFDRIFHLFSSEEEALQFQK